MYPAGWSRVDPESRAPEKVERLEFPPKRIPSQGSQVGSIPDPVR